MENNDSKILRKLRDQITFSSLDFGSDKTLAMIYGMVVGWNKESLNELGQKGILSPQEIQYLETEFKETRDFDKYDNLPILNG